MRKRIRVWGPEDLKRSRQKPREWTRVTCDFPPEHAELLDEGALDRFFDADSRAEIIRRSCLLACKIAILSEEMPGGHLIWQLPGTRYKVRIHP